jgi:competence protein ComGF
LAPDITVEEDELLKLTKIKRWNGKAELYELVIMKKQMLVFINGT